MYDLTSKVAVITGGSQAIGLACSHALGEFGAKVVIADKDLVAADKGKALLAENKIHADTIELDVTNPDNVNAAAQEIQRRYGKVDILVNSDDYLIAGTAAEDVSNEFWLQHMRVLLDGVFHTSRAFGSIMLQQKAGSVVNIGSMSGFIVNRPQNQSYYNAAKGGVHIYTKALAAEWADRGVRVNGVAPTYIEEEQREKRDLWTAETPMNRLGQSREVGSLVAFLASDAASFMTGSIVNVDGGYTCW